MNRGFRSTPSPRNSLRQSAVSDEVSKQQCDFRFDLFFSFSFVLVLQYFFVFIIVLLVIFSFSFVPEDMLMICLNTVQR